MTQVAVPKEAARRQTNFPLKKVSVRVDQLANRRLTGLSGRFEFELFSPHIEDMDCSNNCSIVLKLTGLGARGFSYLITGDTENPRWERINKLFGSSLKSHVLAAPHHGSKNATHPASLVSMLRLVRPRRIPGQTPRVSANRRP